MLDATSDAISRPCSQSLWLINVEKMERERRGSLEALFRKKSERTGWNLGVYMAFASKKTHDGSAL